MFAEERQQLIVELIYASGRASVTDLAERFSITTETVRRDLATLEAAGSVRRVHGGAVSPDRFSTTEESILERTVQRQPEKIRIAEAALALIPAGLAGSILIDAGSTTEALAELLPPGPPDRRNGQRPAQDPTPNSWSSPTPCPSPSRLSGQPGIALHLLGGKVRGLTQAAVGQSTVEAARRIRPDIAFIGTNGIHAAFGLSTPDPEEAAVKAAFVHSARRIVVLADSSKLDAETLVQFASLKDLDTVITDMQPSRELADRPRGSRSGGGGRVIVTLTANPSLDRTVALPGPLLRGEVQRAVSVRQESGGKGVNVSRALVASGLKTVAVLPGAEADPVLAGLREADVPVRGPARSASRCAATWRSPSPAASPPRSTNPDRSSARTSRRP